MFLVCDTNIWIEASKDSQSPSAQMLDWGRSHGWRIAFSKHSRHELAIGSPAYGPGAEALADRFEELQYYPIGRIDELLGTISELSGTFDDMRVNDDLRESLGILATQGTNIRDRGALIDALRSGADYFITADKGIVGAAPRQRIEDVLPIRIRTPSEMLNQLDGLLAQAGQRSAETDEREGK